MYVFQLMFTPFQLILYWNFNLYYQREKSRQYGIRKLIDKFCNYIKQDINRYTARVSKTTWSFWNIMKSFLLYKIKLKTTKKRIYQRELFYSLMIYFRRWYVAWSWKRASLYRRFWWNRWLWRYCICL